MKSSATVYWNDGSVASARSVIFVEDNGVDGQMKDGRPIKLINHKWVIK